ncbi:MAG: hypothetical protein ACJA2O_004108 [Candidatus Azotimanducaceae bacterium]|jgi:hypothetical protein
MGSKLVAPTIHAVVDECYEQAMAVGRINTTALFCLLTHLYQGLM